MKMEVLDFCKIFAQSYNVNVKVINSRHDNLGDFDLGIRSMIIKEYHDAEILDKLYDCCEEYIIYFMNDYFDTEYCIFKIPEKDRHMGDFVLIGPYTKSGADEYELNTLLQENKIPMDLLGELKEYYNAVPVIMNYAAWTACVISLVKSWYAAERTIECVYLNHADAEYSWEIKDKGPDEARLAVKLIEERYEIESELMEAIARGDVEKALELHNRFGNFQIEKRHKDLARNYRNLTVSSNTLYRKAAQAGGVHPVHLDELSSRFGKRVETICSKKEAINFTREMVRKYAMLVKNYSLQGYSPLIQKIVNHIDLNFQMDISLKNLSEEYSVNASYLSSLFKKEMNMPVTAYINQQRMKKAILLLNTTNMQIQDIAANVGIADVNYFSKCFKKYTGKTPREYREVIVRNGYREQSVKHGYL